MSTNFNLGLNQSKTTVHCANCGTLLFTTGDGFASAICWICQSADEGVVLSDTAVRLYMNSLPQSNLNHIDMSMSGDDGIERKVENIQGTKTWFGEKLFRALMPNNKKKAAAPNIKSLTEAKSKVRPSLFSNPLGGSMADVDESLNKDKK